MDILGSGLRLTYVIFNLVKTKAAPGVNDEGSLGDLGKVCAGNAVLNLNFIRADCALAEDVLNRCA